MKCRNLKVGDRVRIKHILAEDSDDYTYGVCREMEMYGGKILTIARAYNSGYSSSLFRMKEDDGKWSWSFSMFESVSPCDEMFIDLNLFL